MCARDNNSMSKSFGRSFRIDKSHSILAVKVFCSWDFKVIRETSVRLMSENICTQLKVGIHRLRSIPWVSDGNQFIVTAENDKYPACTWRPGDSAPQGMLITLLSALSSGAANRGQPQGPPQNCGPEAVESDGSCPSLGYLHWDHHSQCLFYLPLL